jgi:hypothetical protein
MPRSGRIIARHRGEEHGPATPLGFISHCCSLFTACCSLLPLHYYRVSARCLLSAVRTSQSRFASCGGTNEQVKSTGGVKRQTWVRSSPQPTASAVDSGVKVGGRLASEKNFRSSQAATTCPLLTATRPADPPEQPRRSLCEIDDFPVPVTNERECYFVKHR